MSTTDKPPAPSTPFLATARVIERTEVPPEKIRKFTRPPEGGKPIGDDPRRCTANRRRTTERCSNWAVEGRSHCRFHGGKAPIKHGLYSKDQRELVAAKAKRLRHDPELMVLERQAAVSQALQEWGIERFDKMIGLMEDPTVPAEQKLMDVTLALEGLRKLTETSAKIIGMRHDVDDENLVPLALLIKMADVFREAVTTHVESEAVRLQILGKVTRVLDLSSPVAERSEGPDEERV